MTGTIERAHSAVLTVMPPVEVEAVRTLVNLWLLPADAELARANAAVEALWASRVTIVIAGARLAVVGEWPSTTPRSVSGSSSGGAVVVLVGRCEMMMLIGAAGLSAVLVGEVVCAGARPRYLLLR